MNANLLPLTVGGLSLAVSGCYLNKMADNPNIILIMADDLGLNDLGVTGSDYHETPNLDALAKGSMIFTNAYSSAPNSAPSRACLMSGLYTPRHGVYTVNPPDRGVDSKRKYIAIANNDTLEPKFKTIAEELKDNGYKNCHIGKWHLGNIEDKTDPLNRGFDINIGGTHAGAPQSHFFPYAGDAGSAERYPGLEKGTDKEYLTDRLTDEAIRFIKNARLKKQPFFLNLSYFAVHYPIQAPEDLVEKRLLEYKFFQKTFALPASERLKYRGRCRLRMLNAQGEYQYVDNLVQIMQNTPDGKVWLILCLYELSANQYSALDISPTITHMERGEIETLSLKQETNSILSEREKEILELIRKGMRSKEIASELHISINTVNRHRQNILSKLSVSNSIEACRAAEIMKLF